MQRQIAKKLHKCHDGCQREYQNNQGKGRNNPSMAACGLAHLSPSFSAVRSLDCAVLSR